MQASEGKLYLCVFKDLWSNRVVGYAMGPNMTSRLATNALNMPLCAVVGSVRFRV